MSSEAQGMATLDDLLGATSIAPKKESFSWADAPVEAPVEEKPVAKKAAWGSVQTAAAVSIKDQEKEASAKGPAKGPQRSAQSEAPRAPAQPTSTTYAPRAGYEPSDRPRGERWSANTGARTGYSGPQDREERRRDGGDDERRGGYGGSRGGYGEDREERRNTGWGEGPRGDRPRYNPDMPSHGSRGGGDRFGGDSSYGGGSGERREREPRREHAEVPFPTQAPYMLYLTGLPWEGTEQDVRELLPGFWGEDLEAKVKNVKVPIKDGKLRHAFIEFEDADALRSALENTGREFMGRTVTCLVAEPHTGGGRGGDKFGSFGGDRGRGGFGSSFGDRSDRPRYNPEVPSHGGPSERKPLNLAPRTTTSSSSADSGESSGPKPNPFGGATASTRDIYADKSKTTSPTTSAAAATAAPTTTTTRSDSRPARTERSEQPREESRADTRDWKSKDFKPSTNYRSAATGGSSNGKPQGERRTGAQGGRGGARNDDSDWKSAGGKPAPQRKPAPAAAAPTTGNAAADKSNIFDALSDE